MGNEHEEWFRILEERHGAEAGAFLRTVHRRICHRRGDGSFSEPYQCDSVLRPAGMDAVAFLLHFRDASGVTMVGLRASRRPALFLDRPDLPDRPPDGLLWEVPAGIVEAADHGEAGRRRRCSLEAMEEMGVDASPEAFFPLGPPMWLSPGVMAERVYLFAAFVDGPGTVLPTGDGSAMEEDTLVTWVSMEEALARLAEGTTDAKTELALRRFASLASG